MAGQLTRFIGGATGQWRVLGIRALAGTTLGPVARLAIVEQGNEHPGEPVDWVLRGMASHERYVIRPERQLLRAREERLGRSPATRAALIPIVKSATWWEMTQDERRAVFETRSHHIETGARYLPAVARRLFHCRDLGEPFDFLTWFEFAPADEHAFDDLVGRMRESEEWQFVEREIDLRLERVSAS